MGGGVSGGFGTTIRFQKNHSPGSGAINFCNCTCSTILFQISNGEGLKATLQFAHSRLQLCTLGPFGPLFKGCFCRRMTTILGNRGQLWTSSLSPHLLSPHLDFPKECKFVSCAVFVETPPFWAGDKNTVCPKHGFYDWH